MWYEDVKSCVVSAGLLSCTDRSNGTPLLLFPFPLSSQTICCPHAAAPHPAQAEAISQLQEERAQLSTIVQQGLADQAELHTLRQQAGELSGVTQELQQTRHTLLELQAVARQLEQHRVQIASLADQKEEMESALASQAELTAEVALLQQEYDDVLGKARRAIELQEELPKLQVCIPCVGVQRGCRGARRICYLVVDGALNGLLTRV